MKKLFIFVIILTSLFLIAAPVFASDIHPPRIVDNASLLTESEKSEIAEELDEISQRHSCDVVVVTVNSTDGKLVSTFADDYYDHNHYGLGEDKSGILLLISMKERDWYISTAGSAIYTFSYSTLGTIGDDVAGYLSNSDYRDAFMRFASLADYYLTLSENAVTDDSGGSYNNGGSTIDTNPGYNNGYTTDNDVVSYLQAVLLAFFLAVIIALIVVLVMKSNLKSVRRKLTARDYVRQNSLRITNSSEFYLYRTVSRIARPQNNPSSGNRGGGSFGGVHRSSSGTSHGGRGGKF